MRPTTGAVIGLCPIGHWRIFEKPIINEPVYVICAVVGKKRKIVGIAQSVIRGKMREALDQAIKVILAHFRDVKFPNIAYQVCLYNLAQKSFCFHVL